MGSKRDVFFGVKNVCPKCTRFLNQLCRQCLLDTDKMRHLRWMQYQGASGPLVVGGLDCIRAPSRRGRYWEIHPRRPKDFPRPERNLEGREKSEGQRGWISQYLPSFGGVRTFSQHQFFYREWIRKSFPVGREGLTVLKSILPC